MVEILLVTFTAAVGGALILVPLVRSIARRLGIVDRPDAQRKLQRQPVALGGGVAVFAATLLSIVVAWVWVIIEPFGPLNVGSLNIDIAGWREAVLQTQWWFADSDGHRWLTLLLGAAAILVVGLLDDVYTIRGRQKLIAQSFIAMAIVGTGTQINQLSLYFFVVELGPLSIPISVLWLLIAINALNLLDGADGMATTVGMSVCLGLAVLNVQHHGGLPATLAAIGLGGALAGFLVFNRPPATIYLGDAGSMMIGLCVGVLAMWCSLKEQTVVAAAPIAILVLPLFDSTAAIIRRWMTGRSMYATDRGHLHHLLQQRFGNRLMLWIVGGLCALASAASVMSVAYELDWLPPLTIIGTLGLLVFSRTFGHTEARLLSTRLYRFVLSLFRRPTTCDAETVDLHHFRPVNRRERDWAPIWEPLVQKTKSCGFEKVKVDISLPWLHEGYHAAWQAARLPEKGLQTILRLPLHAHHGPEGELIAVGRIELVTLSTLHLTERLVPLLDFIESLPEQLSINVGRHHDTPLPDAMAPPVGRAKPSEAVTATVEALDAPEEEVENALTV